MTRRPSSASISALAHGSDEAASVAYEKIADAVEKAIKAGAYSANSRMPSVRVLADQWGVSLSTAARAYHELEHRGLLRSEARRGYFVVEGALVKQALSGEFLVSSATRELLQLDHLGVDGGASWTSSRLSQSLWPARSLKNAFREMARAIDAPMDGGFADPSGHPRLREHLARQLYTDGVQVTPDDVIVLNGLNEALEMVLDEVAAPGCEVVVFAPLEPMTLRLLERHQLRVHEIPVDVDRGASLDVLRYIFDNHPIAAVLAWPNGHPVNGAVFSQEQQLTLHRMCADARAVLIRDESLADLIYDQGHRSNAPFDPEDSGVVMIGGLAAQWGSMVSLSWLTAGTQLPSMLERSVMRGHSTRMSMQALALQLVEHDDWLVHQKRLRTQLAQAQQTFERELLPLLPPGCSSPMPSTGMMRWVHCPPEVARRASQRALGAGLPLCQGIRCSVTSRYDSDFRFNLSALEPGVWADRLRMLFTSDD